MQSGLSNTTRAPSQDVVSIQHHSPHSMSHYCCTGGCQGVSGVPGTCQAKDCADYKKPLKKCDCTSPKHLSGADDELSLETGTVPGVDEDDLTIE